jgi:hypothetical protein
MWFPFKLFNSDVQSKKVGFISTMLVNSWTDEGITKRRLMNKLKGDLNLGHDFHLWLLQQKLVTECWPFNLWLNLDDDVEF